MNIYEFFNSKDIADHCNKLMYKFSATEMAYIVWQSNHKSISQKHTAWNEIIATTENEKMPLTYDIEEIYLHDFLRKYIQIEKDFIDNFQKASGEYIYTVGYLFNNDDGYIGENTFYNSYELCLEDVAKNINGFLSKVTEIRINRNAIQSRINDPSDEEESIYFNNNLEPIDFSMKYKMNDLHNGFKWMCFDIPTPFQAGDIVINTKSYGTPSIYVIDRLPYWTSGAKNGRDYSKQVESLRENGGDWSNMNICAYAQDDRGEVWADIGPVYLDLEYYRGDLLGKEKLLYALSNYIKGEIYIDDLLRSHSVLLLEHYASEMRKSSKVEEIQQLAGLIENKKVAKNIKQ